MNKLMLISSIYRKFLIKCTYFSTEDSLNKKYAAIAPETKVEQIISLYAFDIEYRDIAVKKDEKVTQMTSYNYTVVK